MNELILFKQRESHLPKICLSVHFVFVYTLNLVSEPSLSIKETVRLLIQTRRAIRIGFKRGASAIGAVE